MAGDVSYTHEYLITPVFGSMSAYQIIQNCQCFNDLQVQTYKLGTLTSSL